MKLPAVITKSFIVANLGQLQWLLEILIVSLYETYLVVELYLKRRQQNYKTIYAALTTCRAILLDLWADTSKSIYLLVRVFLSAI